MTAKRLWDVSLRAFALRSLVSSDGPVSRRLIAAALAGSAAALGGCAQQPSIQRVAAHSKEYFPSSKWGPASPRVVADGEPVPRGGGSYMVGKPYSVAGRTYYPSERKYAAVGLASWYGDAFHGRRTANGEIYDRDSISAAHPTMPLPSYARVTNLSNHRSIIVRVNDRGPFVADRIMDVSRRTAEALEFHRGGTARVKVEYVAGASLAGSDDEKLLATLRMNRPAQLGENPTLVAEGAPQPQQTASLAPVRQDTLGAQDLPSRAQDPAFAETKYAPAAAEAAAPSAAKSGPASEKRSLAKAPKPAPRETVAMDSGDDDVPAAAKPRLSHALAAAPLPPARPGSLSAPARRVNVALRTKQAD